MTTPMSVEVTASTIENAIQKGLKQLGVGPGQVIVEVIQEPNRGLLGFGSKQAKVRLQRLTPPPKKPAEEQTSTTAEPDASDAPPAGEAGEALPEPAPQVIEPDLTDPQTAELEAIDDPGIIPQPERTEAPPRPQADTAAEPDVVTGQTPQSAPDDEQAVEEEVSDTELSDDYDSFFDEDGGYGVDDEEFYQPAAERRRRQARRDQAAPSPSQQATLRDEESQPSQDREQAQLERRRQLEADTQPPAVSESADDPPAATPAKETQQMPTRPAGSDTGVRVPPVTYPENADDGKMAEQIVGEMLDIMRIGGDIEVTRSQRGGRNNDNASWVVNIQGQGRSFENLVGKGGETLTALQYLVRLMVSKKTEARANVIVDVNDQRTSHADKLIRIAQRMADQVAETGRPFKMEPMPAHERRIVHKALYRRKDVTTQSKGRGDERRVLIIPEANKDS